MRPWGNVIENSAPPEAERKILRVGMDLGLTKTVFQASRELAELLVPRTQRVPTWIAYTDHRFEEEGMVLVGDDALEWRDTLPLVHPLSSGDPRHLKDFAQAIRLSLLRDRGVEVWGVINCPQGGDSADLKNVRLLANEIFDRTCLLDPSLLMATSFGSQEAARNSLWIDLGASSLRAALILGGSPKPGETLIIPGGGREVDRRLREGLHRRFPDLSLSDLSLERIKERFAHVEPALPVCRLKVVLDQKERVIDIGSIVRRACEPVVDEVLHAVRRALAAAPSDIVEDLLGHVVVVGAGARMSGLKDRLAEEMRREFGTMATVRIPADPTVLVANGALRWAHFLQDEEWEIPLFSLAR